MWLAFVLGLFVPFVFLPLVLRALRERYDMQPRGREEPKDIPTWLSGTLERLAFTPLVIVLPAAAIAAMGAWIGMKIVAGWQDAQPVEAGKDKDGLKAPCLTINQVRAWRQRSLLFSFLSMASCFVGGRLMAPLLRESWGTFLAFWS